MNLLLLSVVDGMILTACSTFISTSVLVGSTSDITWSWLSLLLIVPLVAAYTISSVKWTLDDDSNEGNLSGTKEGFGDGLVSDSVTIAVDCGATGSPVVAGADFLAGDFWRALTCCSWLIVSNS